MQVVRDIMTTDVVTLEPEMTLREAAMVFADHHVSGAPVVANGRVLGVLSASDILWVEAGSLDGPQRGPDETDQPEDEDDPAPFFARLWPDAALDVNERFGTANGPGADRGGDRLDRQTVFDTMTRGVLEVRPDATITQAADRMATAAVHRLLVVDDEGLAGIVTTTDIARWLAGRLQAMR